MFLLLHNSFLCKNFVYGNFQTYTEVRRIYNNSPCTHHSVSRTVNSGPFLFSSIPLPTFPSPPHPGLLPCHLQLSLYIQICLSLYFLWDFRTVLSMAIVEDSGAWCAAVQGVAKSQTWLSNLTTIIKLIFVLTSARRIAFISYYFCKMDWVCSVVLIFNICSKDKISFDLKLIQCYVSIISQ